MHPQSQWRSESAGLQKVSAQLEASKAAPQVVTEPIRLKNRFIA